MDEYQHYERFNMDNEFSGGQWIGGEFYFKKRKERRGQTREEALYGFEESDSDAEDYSRKRRKDLIKKGDLSKPVSFVSIGTVMPSEEVEKKDEDPDAPAFKPGLGSGTTCGLGFNSAQTAMEEEDDLVLPSVFGKRIKEAAERREREREREKMKISASAKTSGGVKVSDMPEFEKHTKGIGLKLLEKMGYKGGGLGKNEQGIAVPIEAKLRPKNMGMGFNDFKEAASGLTLPAGTEQAEDRAKEIKPKVKEKLWLKRNRGKKKEYRTAEELITQKSEQGVEVVQTILDMRGPQVRVLTNLEHLNAEQVDKDDQIPMPELQHNMRLIVDLVEADIQNYDRKLRHEKESVVILENERERLQNQVTIQKRQIDSVEAIMNTIDTVLQKVAIGSLTLEALVSIFSTLQKEHWEDYKLYNVSVIALSVALPMMVNLFQGWEPLIHPFRGIEMVSSWKSLLQGDDPLDYSIFPQTDVNGGYASYGAPPPYMQLVMEAVFPALRFAAINTWEPRDPEPMLRFLEAWEKLLPAPVLQSVLDHLVMPKLTAAVDLWDPRQETVPIHAWLHPWLPLLGQRMEPLYHPIRYKLGEALRAWHPSDGSAYAILSPWQTVFDPGSWEQLVVRYIVPKLIVALQEFVVNPRAQQLERFNWVMAWSTAVPMHHMAALLEAGFFSKWLEALYHWLHSGPNFEEITEWYLGWKSLLTPELLANERIRRQLQIALEMMNQAVEGMPVVQPGARENISYLRVTEQRQFETQQQQQAAAAYVQQQTSSYAGENGANLDVSLKEAVEIFAEQNDIQFLPKVGRSHEGLQVYGFGSINVLIDSVNQKLCAQAGDKWTSVTMEQLLEMHWSKSGRWK